MKSFARGGGVGLGEREAPTGGGRSGITGALSRLGLADLLRRSLRSLYQRDQFKCFSATLIYQAEHQMRFECDECCSN